jgi:four helix bundle protein
MKRNELEERLIDFSVLIIKLSSSMIKTKAGQHLSGQIIRSGTSVALNYGEAQSAESKKDFIHKMQVVLKELRETFVCLKILEKAKLCSRGELLLHALKENNELISIFVKSVSTAQKTSKIKTR